MPAIGPDSFFSLSDYLSSRGFEDGDDRVAKSKGVRWRNDALKILRNHLQSCLVPWTVEAYDLQSLHNDVRIRLLDENQKTLDIEVTSEQEISIGNISLFVPKFQEDWAKFKSYVWPRASNDFENWVLLNDPDTRPGKPPLILEPIETLSSHQAEARLFRAAERWVDLYRIRSVTELSALQELKSAAIHYYRTRRGKK